MNTISKTHQRFSEFLENPRVITNPEEFLGPNFEEVLNFWIILDELSQEQLRVIKKRYEAFCEENSSEWRKATDLAYEASEKVVGKDYTSHASCAAWDDIYSYAAGWATRELIGMHIILEQQPLTFFEMILD